MGLTVASGNFLVDILGSPLFSLFNLKIILPMSYWLEFEVVGTKLKVPIFFHGGPSWNLSLLLN